MYFTFDKVTGINKLDIKVDIDYRLKDKKKEGKDVKRNGGKNNNMIQQLDKYKYLIDGYTYDKRNVDDLLYIEGRLKDLADTVEADTKAEKVEADKVDDIVEANDEIEEAEEEVKVDKIDFKQDIFLPTHEKVRNNNIEEKGRGRQRNTNDVYKNLSISCVIGKVVDNMDGEFTKLLYEKDIDEQLEKLKAEGVTKLPKKNRLTKDLTLISNQLGAELVDIVNTRENGLCYIIKQSKEGKYFTSIPLYKWRELIISTNKELLRLYTVISMHKAISTTNYVLMTREYLCMCMDMEPSEANQNYIGIATTSLFKLGLIDIEQEDRIVFEDGQRKNKTYNFYRLTTYEEYEAKGKKKKRRRKH